MFYNDHHYLIKIDQTIFLLIYYFLNIFCCLGNFQKKKINNSMAFLEKKHDSLTCFLVWNLQSFASFLKTNNSSMSFLEFNYFYACKFRDNSLPSYMQLFPKRKAYALRFASFIHFLSKTRKQKARGPHKIENRKEYSRNFGL